MPTELPLNERFALKDLVEWPMDLPYPHRATAYGQPSSMPALEAKGLVYVVGEDEFHRPLYRPTPEGHDRYLADDLGEIDFTKLYRKRRRAHA